MEVRTAGCSVETALHTVLEVEACIFGMSKSTKSRRAMVALASYSRLSHSISQSKLWRRQLQQWQCQRQRQCQSPQRQLLRQQQKVELPPLLTAMKGSQQARQQLRHST